MSTTRVNFATGPDGTLVGIDDPAAQTCQVLANLRAALERAGSIRPASAMDEVSGLVDPRMLVEIEADACIAGAMA